MVRRQGCIKKTLRTKKSCAICYLHTSPRVPKRVANKQIECQPLYTCTMHWNYLPYPDNVLIYVSRTEKRTYNFETRLTASRRKTKGLSYFYTTF